MLYQYKKADPFAYKIPKKQADRNKKVTLYIATFSFLTGASILIYSSFPYLKNEFFPENTDKSLISTNSKTNSSLAAGSFTNVNFTQGYLDNVSKSFESTNAGLNIESRTFAEYASIKGNMKIKIPAIDVDEVNVQLNVDSFDESEYMPLLDTTLAHFKGTSLPDKPGNTFIYGHSTDVLLAQTNRNDPRFAFTFLNDLDIGEEIIIDYEGKTYKYITQKIRRVSPEDISPIYTTSDDQTLTLMTCWPPGIGTERLIVSTLFTGVE